MFKSKPIQSLFVNLIKATAAFGLVKLVAFYGGTTALASFSNYQNLVGLMAVFVTLSLQTGLTVAVARDKKDHEPVFSSIRAAICLFPLAVVGSYFFSSNITLKNDLLAAEDYLIYSAVLILPFALNILLVAVEIGFERYGNILVNTLLVGCIPFIYLIFTGHNFVLQNMLLILGIGNWAGAIYLLFKIKFRPTSILPFSIDFKLLKPLMYYGLMSGSLGIFASATALVTRHYLSENLGLETAGQWDALIKIGVLFQFVIAAPIISTGLPVVAAALIRNSIDIKHIVYLRIKILCALILILVAVVLSLSDWIILLLFSNDFLPISDYVLVIIIIEGLKALAGVFFLVPLANRQLSSGIFNHLLFTVIILFGLYVLSSSSLLTLSSVAWLYLSASFIFALVSFVWTTVWFRARSKTDAS